MKDSKNELLEIVSALKGHLLYQRDILLSEGVPITPPNPLFVKEGVPKAGALSPLEGEGALFMNSFSIYNCNPLF